VKRRDPHTHAWTHHDWGVRFAKLREATNSSTPGYLWHEAVHYSQKKDTWVFAPRKRSSGKYNTAVDELRGSNLVLTASGDFSTITSIRVGAEDQAWGWTSVRDVPGDPRALMAGLRVTEVQGYTQTALAVFDLSGRSYLNEGISLVGKGMKFEGIEFDEC